MPNIVTLNVSQQVAPFPNNLQRTGAFVSQGGTTTAKGTITFLTQYSDLTAILPNAAAITSLTWLSNVVTVTTAAPHGLPNNDNILLTIAGVVPMAYNGTFTAHVTGANTFTYPLTGSNPGAATTPGAWINEDVSELCAMALTFFGQGRSQPVFVYECGPGTPAEGVATLNAFIQANFNNPQPTAGDGSTPTRYYGYLVPRTWAAEPTFLTMIAAYNAPDAMQYFWVTASLATYGNFTNLMKCVLVLVEAPGIDPTAEFSLAAGFRQALSYRPSATNKVTPFCFSYVYGVTPYPLQGNAALLQTFKNTAVNYIGTGAEGGISNTIFVWGTFSDGKPLNYWYAADWAQIQLRLNIANAIINGSNNPLNPLYYDQPGIDRLEAVAAKTMNIGRTFGLVLNPVIQLGLDGPALDDAINAGTFEAQTIVNAVPFIPYSDENPGDYGIGVYSGFSAVFTPLRGFEQIFFNLVVSDFVTA